MNVWKNVWLVCMLCAPAVYGQRGLGQLAQRAKVVPHTVAVERAVATRVRPASAAAISHAGEAVCPKISSVLIQQQALQASTLGGNTISRKMQRSVARQLRPYLFSAHWSLPPKQAAAYNNLREGIDTAGNLTQMSEEQFAQATKVYLQTMDKVKALSKQADVEIYYLGTSEAQCMPPEHIRRILASVMEVQGAVTRAQIVWGRQPVLQEAELYAKNLHHFYMTLATGVYFPLETEPQRPYVRPDGHRYVASEFGLWSERVEPIRSAYGWNNPGKWFFKQSGLIPQQQRIAVLQDSQDVLYGLQSMVEQAGLDGWQIDAYEDPEEFLNKVPFAQYDLILTDILMKNGGGRYLARQLRSQGYEGTILALSGFDAEHSGKLFFDDGIDGMIPLIAWPGAYASSFWSSLNNYYILKSKYGWVH